MAGSTVLLLSNGHGEDVVAARLARALVERRPDLTVLAFPTVGTGRALANAPVTRIGPLRMLPSAGMTFRSLPTLRDDLRAGLVGTTLAQVRALRAQAPSVVISVGDVWAETLALLPRAPARYAVQTLVSARMDDGRRVVGLRAFRERFTWVERTLLRSAFRRAYLRDEPSADSLRRRGVATAAWLGNPMVDELDPPTGGRPDAAEGTPVVALLPGTRDHAASAFAQMLAALAVSGRTVALVPWALDTLPSVPPAWTASRPSDLPGVAVVLRRGEVEVRVLTDGFTRALAQAEVAVGTAGTAHEQAASVGVPVIAFPAGPGYTRSFLDAQRRLLGDAVEVVEPETNAVAGALRRLLADPDEMRRRSAIGRSRMGAPGASRAIAKDVIADAVAGGWIVPAPGAPAPAPEGHAATL